MKELESGGAGVSRLNMDLVSPRDPRTGRTVWLGLMLGVLSGHLIGSIQLEGHFTLAIPRSIEKWGTCEIRDRSGNRPSGVALRAEHHLPGRQKPPGR